MAVIRLPITEYKELNLRAQKAEELEEKHTRLEEANHRLKQENELLRELLRLERIRKYGAKSETLNNGQLELLEEEPSVEEAEIEKEAQLPPVQREITKKREHEGRSPLPTHLPRKEEVLTVEAEKRACPCCGRERHRIGYEEKEELDIEPIKYFVRVIKREKLACPKCPQAGVITATVRAQQIIEKSKLSDGVIVDILIKKYAEHTPLYRQQAILERDFGIEIARSTLNQAVLAAGSLLEPIAAALKADLLQGNYIQADETPIGVQSGKSIGKNHTAFAFQYSRPGGPVVFDFQMSRGREGPKKFLGNYSGILQSDGFAGYEKIGAAQIIRAGCMAHARRKFIEVLKLDPSNADGHRVINLMTRLYAIETEARKNKLCTEKRLELRQNQSTALMEELRAQLIEIRTRALPSSSLAKACNYALSQWKKLTTFLDHGIVEIDQNLCENAMRPLALGRKNWLHIGSEKAGPKIAAILSIFETCKRLKINIRDYLNDVLPKLGNWLRPKVADLTPNRWAASKISI
jgi:transposase